MRHRPTMFNAVIDCRRYLDLDPGSGRSLFVGQIRSPQRRVTGELPESENGTRQIPEHSCLSDLARCVLHIFSMGWSLAWGPGTIRMRKERVWSSAIERTARPVRGAYRASPRWATFNDGIVVVCFLALVGVVVVGGLFMLLSWVTTTLPTNTRIACPQQATCEASASDGGQSVLGDDGPAREPKPTP